MRDYDYYRLACDDIEAPTMPLWQFRVAYSLYQRHFYDAVDVDIESGEISIRKGYFPIVPWTKLRKIAKAVDRGRELARSRPAPFGDEGTTGGSGVREPRRPVPPTLTGAGARSLHPVDREYDGAILQ